MSEIIVIARGPRASGKTTALDQIAKLLEQSTFNFEVDTKQKITPDLEFMRLFRKLSPHLGDVFGEGSEFPYYHSSASKAKKDE